MTTALRIAFTTSLLLVAQGTLASNPDDSKPTNTRVTYNEILADYDTAMKRFEEAAEKAKTEKEFTALFMKLHPDTVDYSRRFVDLAASDPTDPAARDALIWVLMQCRSSISIKNPLAEQVGRAVELLVRHYSDDLSVTRATLLISEHQSPPLNRLFNSLFDLSKTREVKGTACLVLARNLLNRASLVNRLHREKQPFRISSEEIDESGKTTTRLSEPLFEAAYETELRALGPDALKREADRLFERVVSEYADIPYVVGVGGPWTERSLARKRTLGQEVKASLDAARILAVGMPAPGIDAPCLDGMTRKLSDYRGKVVVLVFWGSWCGPCMQQVPHERELFERNKDRPFAILGVDAEVEQDEGLKAVSQQKMTWPHFYDGAPGEGPIVARYHVSMFPSVFVIDAKGVIRFKNASGKELDKAVEELLKEVESPKM
jgi:peroxiredoxin